ncbi:MAG: ATP-dependent sacrificial sulfur transferase LarE [Anaerolineae bacterium]
MDDKLRCLQQRLGDLRPLAIAFSGGVDSSLLLRVAVDTLGRDAVLAVTADSPLTARSELERAKQLAHDLGAQHLVVPSSEFEDERLRANPPDRCYICKRSRFEQLRRLAAASGYPHLADGTNVDDAADYRPGTRAAVELGVVSPLRDAGLTKADIRALSRSLGLPTADLPSFACLASRVPYGTRLEEAQLRRIEQSESLLADLGLRQYRVRDHGDVARLEVLPEDFSLVVANREWLVASLRELGYTYVALDLAGYRMGSMNEGVA